jgi:hypothetical protein
VVAILGMLLAVASARLAAAGATQARYEEFLDRGRHFRTFQRRGDWDETSRWAIHERGAYHQVRAER